MFKAGVVKHYVATLKGEVEIMGWKYKQYLKSESNADLKMISYVIQVVGVHCVTIS